MSTYLRLITKYGFTIHMGGFLATDFLLGQMDIKKGQRILDIGCGIGNSSFYIAKNYPLRVVGLDNANDALTIAKDRLKKDKIRDVKFVLGSATALPFKEDYFDIVLLESVLLFIEDKNLVFAEIDRVLKKGGFLAFNEFAITSSAKEQTIKDYFKQEEFGGYLISSQDYKNLLADYHVRVWDEESFDLIEEIRLNLSKLIKPSRIPYFLELAYRSIFDHETKHDVWQLINFIKHSPANIKDFITIKVLAVK